MTTDICVDIAEIAVDILARGEYSVFQLDDIANDLEVVSNAAVHSKAAERQA